MGASEIIREFKIVKTGNLPFNKHGIYTGRAPGQAALKAFNRLCKDNKITGECTDTITLQDTDTGKYHTYEAIRFKLNPPRIVKRGNTEFLVKYDRKVKKISSK